MSEVQQKYHRLPTLHKAVWLHPKDPGEIADMLDWAVWVIPPSVVSHRLRSCRAPLEISVILRVPFAA